MFFLRMLILLGIAALGFFVAFYLGENNLVIGFLEITFRRGLVIWLIFTAIGGSVVVFTSESVRAPEQTATVTVASKATQTWSAGTYYFVSFEFPDGARKNFMMNVNQYNSVVENEIGTLTYKDLKKPMFISFNPNVPSH